MCLIGAFILFLREHAFKIKTLIMEIFKKIGATFQ